MKSFDEQNTIKQNTEKNIYLDNAGATQIDENVLCAMHGVESLYANPSGIYRSGIFAKEKIEESRKIISSILNCNSSEVFFTGSGTESVNVAILGYIKSYISENKNENKSDSFVIPKVITTNIEHSAVLESLNHLYDMGIIEIIYLKVDESGRVNENDVREILKETGPENKNNIIMVSVMYANNETGRVQPIKEIGRIINEYNINIIRAARGARGKAEPEIVFHLDAMQAGNYFDIDVKKLRCHMFSVNASKIYGPKGVGVLYKSKKVNLSAISFGGGQEKGIRSGTEDVTKIVGMAKAMQIAKEKRDTEIVRLLGLQNYFLENIKLSIPEVKIYTEKNNVNRVVDMHGGEAAATKTKSQSKIKINYFNLDSIPNNLNIGLPGMLSDEMVIRLDYSGFDVSHKSACASNEVGEGSYVLRAMGSTEKESNENIRITMGRDTKLENLQKLILEIKNIYLKYKS